jgi:hypothetical protein
MLLLPRHSCAFQFSCHHDAVVGGRQLPSPAGDRGNRQIDPSGRRLHGDTKLWGKAVSDIGGQRAGYKRFIIYELLSTMTLINYFNRTVLPIPMPVLIQQFALTPVVVGYLLSTFIWSYALCQLPPGVMLAR